MLVGTDWDHHMSALLDKESKMKPLYQNEFPKDTHDKYQLQVDCMFQENTLSVILEQNHSCMNGLQDRHGKQMLRQDWIYHLGISGEKKNNIISHAISIKLNVW